MKKGRLLFILPILLIPLGALEIRIDGGDTFFFTEEELRDYARVDDRANESVLPLSHILPLMDEIYQLRAWNGRNSLILEEPEETLRQMTLRFTERGFGLYREDYRFDEPALIELYGKISQETELIVLLPEEDLFTLKRLEDFCRFRGLSFKPLVSPDPAVDFLNRIMQKKELPHLVFFSDRDAHLVEPYVRDSEDYQFSLVSLFSHGRRLKTPMDPKNPLTAGNMTYAWDPYDFRIITLFAGLYDGDGELDHADYVNALVLQRSLYEMGFLKPSRRPGEEKSDFFMESTDHIDLGGVINYPDFLPPLTTYTQVAAPLGRSDSLLVEQVRSFLLSQETQSLIGRESNGFYPAVNTVEYTHPADPCLLLLSRHGSSSVRIGYSGESEREIPFWSVLSRLSLNTSHSIDKLLTLTTEQLEESLHD